MTAARETSIDSEPFAVRSLRVVTALVGGYAVMVGASAMIGALLPHLGLARSEATSTLVLLAFPIYMIFMMAAFAVSRPLCHAIATALVAAAMIMAAPLLAPPL
ncbi:MAG: hypothetical protein AAGG79_05945 [Pseudomonadota bacterium]